MANPMWKYLAQHFRCTVSYSDSAVIQGQLNVVLMIEITEAL